MAISIRGTAGAWVAATATTQTVTLPTHATGDMLLVRVGMKHATLPGNITCATAGWAKIGQFNNGTTASGNGTGDVCVAVFWKIATSAAETNPTITYHASVAATPSCASPIVFQKASSDVWVTPPPGDGGAIAAATSMSATIQTHISATAGDMIVSFLVTNDNTTLTVPTFTQTGLTLDTVTEAPATALSDATSNDISADACFRLVTAGTSSAAAVVTGTNSVADVGAAWTTRLRVAPILTTLYMRNAASNWGTGNNDANLRGTAFAWRAKAVATSAGSSATLLFNAPTVTGPTSGVEYGSGSLGLVWYSPPLDADVTIAGPLTWNIWASENNTSANVAINGILEVVDTATGTITEIHRTTRTTEVALTTRALNTFSETPGAGVACKRGDRLRVRIFGDDAGTMATGFTFGVSIDGSTGGADGDTWLALSEALTFVSEPAGTTIYPTDTASAVSTASVDREAWTSRGGGVADDVVSTVSGWAAPVQLTDTAGGTVVDWFTRPLTAFTLGGAVRVNARVKNNGSSQAVHCQLAVVAGDGTGPTVWGATQYPETLITTTETALSFLVSGDDVAVSDGQRLRIRFSIDDPGELQMVSGWTVTFYYAGTSGGASGDTYVTFTQTLTEFVTGTVATPTTAALVLATFAPTVTTPQTLTPTTATLAATAFAPTIALAVIPTTATLTLATFAPTVTASAHQLLTPTTATLTLATFGSTVTASDHQTVTPTTAALVLTTFAPTATAANPQLVTPTTAALTLATFVPTVTATDHQLATPTTAALTLTTYAPTVSAPNPQLVTPTTAALTTATFAPVIGLAVIPTTAALVTATFQATVTASNHQLVTPTTAALSTATFAPTVSTPRLITPTTVSLTLTTFAPTISLPQLVTPTTASLVTATFAPVIGLKVTPTTVALTTTTFAPVIKLVVTPTTVALTTATFAPTVSATAHVVATPTTASLVTTSFAATVTFTAHQTVTPTTVALVLATQAPSVTTGGNVEFVPDKASLTLTTFAPTVTGAANVTVTPTTAALITAVFAPTVTRTQHQLVTPTTAALTLAVFTPAVSATDVKLVTPTTATLVTAKFAPTVTASNHKLVTPTTKAVVLTTFAPTLTATAHQVATPTTASLTATRFAPTVTASNQQAIVPATAALTLTTYAPTVTAIANVVAVPSPASLALTTTIPVLRLAVIPGTAVLATSTFAPSVSATAHVVFVPPPAALELTTYAPIATGVAPMLVVPDTLALVLTAYPPHAATITASLDIGASISAQAVVAASLVSAPDGVSASLVVTPPVRASLSANGHRRTTLVVKRPGIRGRVDQ